MGVVYKIKPEIVSFIISEKQNNHNLSCRRLVNLVKAQFDVKVSKSSINTILKDHSLSDSVGRKPVYKAPKNFSIPKEKKQIMRDNVSSLLEGKKKRSFLLEPDKLGVVKQDSKVVSEEIKNVSEKIKEKSFQRGKGPHLLPDIVSSINSEVERVDQKEDEKIKKLIIKSIFSNKNGVKSSILNIFIFLAMVHDADPQRSWSHILIERMGLNIAEHKRTSFEVVCLLESLMGDVFDVEYQKIAQELEELFSISEKDITLWREAFQDKHEDVKLGYALEVACQAVSLGVSKIHFEFKRGANFECDPFWSQAWQESLDYQPERPLFPTILSVADMWVSNVIPIIFGDVTLGLSHMLVQDLLQIVAGGDVIQSIQLLDRQDNLLWEHREVIVQPKEFIFATKLSDQDLDRVDMDIVDNSQAVYDKFSDEMFLCMEGKYRCPGTNEEARLLFLCNSVSGEKLALITNLQENRESILNKYFTHFFKCINHKEHSKNHIFDIESPLLNINKLNKSNMTPQNNLLVDTLKRFVCDIANIYLPMNEGTLILERLSSFKNGEVCQSSEGVFILLKSQDDNQENKNVVSWAQMFNGFALKGPLDRQYFFSYK